MAGPWSGRVSRIFSRGGTTVNVFLARSGTGRFPMRTWSLITPRPNGSTALRAVVKTTSPLCRNLHVAIRESLCHFIP